MLKKLLYPLIMLSLMVFMTPQTASAAVLPWEAMVNSTFTSAPRSPGFGDPANQFVSSMATFGDYLYVATYNDDQGTEIWRTNNGTSWEQVNEDGFGAHATSLSILAVFNDHLYAFPSVLAPGTVVAAWRTDNGTAWELAKDNIAEPSPTSILPWATAVYNNSLYVGLLNTDDEVIVVGSNNGSTWTQINTDDFDDPDNFMIQSMASFDGKLYVGVENDTDGAEVWHYDGAIWAQDNTDGFDNADNVSVGSLSVFNNQLYAFTLNEAGVEVWRTPTGNQAWGKVTDGGFGQGVTVNVVYDSAVFRDALFVGANSGKVFRSNNGNTWEQVNVDGFGYADNYMVMFGILGDYIYAGVGTIAIRGLGEPETVEIYRYYEPTTLPQTGFDNPLNAYILDALL